MRKNFLSAAYFSAFAFFLITSVISTEEVSSTGFAYGTVVNVAEDYLTVSEYDYENDEEVEKNYFVDSQAEIKGADSILGIAVDDNVDIAYRISNGKNIAQSITVEKPSEEDGPAAVEQDAPATNK